MLPTGTLGALAISRVAVKVRKDKACFIQNVLVRRTHSGFHYIKLLQYCGGFPAQRASR